MKWLISDLQTTRKKVECNIEQTCSPDKSNGVKQVSGLNRLDIRESRKTNVCI
jgi:hypothetical protein